MFGFLKKEKTYDNDDLPDSKAGMFFYTLKKAINNLIYCIIRCFGMEKPSHYDLDVDDDHTPQPYQTKTMVCNIIFVVYGFLAGWIGQQYAEYECRSFQAFACNMSLTSPDLYATPLTILVNIVIIFSVYLSIAVIWGCIYFGIKATWLKNDGDEEIEMLQIAAMYGLLTIVFVSLFFFALPFNMFIFAHS